ncbi:hypothetical protein FDG96_gp43 [Bacillus phage Mgbh1]|uniref:Uncharacterized protein n=1 Tax=Bacillus phage Mgbh1 TaxID=1796993 RepID=A0A142F1P5_9CAUD|nr:hypothetical protein FDG96_gp43 [Bacillus phage Mgbh1]AMQ66702.1 hypothetical protein [Bacillus phage Mgbh1]
MRKYIERNVKQRELVGFTCNKCGKSVDLTEDDFAGNLFHSFKTSFHYGSAFDMETWEFDLCEDCLLDIVKTFKVEPDGVGIERDLIEFYDLGGEVSE